MINIERLALFSGSQNIYTGFMGTKHTDGCHYLIANDASWLISDIAIICKMQKKVKQEPFVSIKTKIEDNQCIVEYTDGNNNKLFSQKYSYTDLPNGNINFYFTDNTLMLSSEY